ncbi:MAG: YggT family protein [Candidatus Omnitrophica bacterium]|nr:YggT family protein [Candidatus Omnitrophota bacterium]
MFILANFISAVARVLDIVINVFVWLIVIRAIVSWVSADPLNPIVQFLHKATEPLLAPIRKLLPFSLKMTIDISPIVAVLVLIFMQLFLVRSLFDIADRLRMAM